MSYQFNDTTLSGGFRGQFGSSFNVPCTLAMFVKTPATFPTSRVAFNISDSTSAFSPGVFIGTDSSDTSYRAYGNGSAAYSASYTGTAGAYDDTWVPIVAVFQNSSPYCKVYVGSYSNAASQTSNPGFGSTALQYISVGQGRNADQWGSITGYVAEVAIWDAVLSQTDIENYLAGYRATGIDATNLTGYWPLSANNSTQADQSGNGGPTLTLGGSVGTPTHSSDHPTILEWTTKKLKLLAHSSAASASGVAGVVFSAPSGSDITGTTRYGEFTGKTFEASLESGKAVLKVPVADFGGTALTTSDTPVALVRNTTYTTGLVSCTVIEE